MKHNKQQCNLSQQIFRKDCGSQHKYKEMSCTSKSTVYSDTNNHAWQLHPVVTVYISSMFHSKTYTY